jgi:hypothetical protein
MGEGRPEKLLTDLCGPETGIGGKCAVGYAFRGMDGGKCGREMDKGIRRNQVGCVHGRLLHIWEVEPTRT